MTDTAQATATVTITLSRDDALWWRNVIDEPHTWGNPGEAQRVLSAVVAALTVAPPPAPSDLEQAITACHDRNLNLCTWRTESGEYAATVTTRTYPMLRPTTCRGEGVTLTEAVRAALAAGRSAGEGT